MCRPIARLYFSGSPSCQGEQAAKCVDLDSTPDVAMIAHQSMLVLILMMVYIAPLLLALVLMLYSYPQHHESLNTSPTTSPAL